MYILLLHTQVIGLGTLGLVYTLSTEALPRMEATRGKVKAWRVDSLRSGDLEEVNSKAMSISCEQLRFQFQDSSEKLGLGHGVGSWERQPRRRSAHEGGRVERGADTKDMWCRNQPLCSPSTASAAETISKHPPTLPCFVSLGVWEFVVMVWVNRWGRI